MTCPARHVAVILGGMLRMSRIARGERLRRYASRVVACCRDDFIFFRGGFAKFFCVACHRDVALTSCRDVIDMSRCMLG